MEGAQGAAAASKSRLAQMDDHTIPPQPLDKPESLPRYSYGAGTEPAIHSKEVNLNE